MIRLISALLGLTFLLVSCDSPRGQEAKQPEKSQQVLSETQPAGGAAHVRQDEEPKNTPQQPSLVAQPSPQDQIAQAVKLLDEAKRALAREGKYNCCTDYSCDECAIGHGSCGCNKSLKANKPVCGECYAAWQRGEGKDPRIKASEVKVSVKSHAQ